MVKKKQIPGSVKKTHGTVFSYFVVPTTIQITCVNCKLPSEHTLELAPTESSTHPVYCPLCHALNKVPCPSASTAQEQAARESKQKHAHD